MRALFFFPSAQGSPIIWTPADEHLGTYLGGMLLFLLVQQMWHLFSPPTSIPFTVVKHVRDELRLFRQPEWLEALLQLDKNVDDHTEGLLVLATTENAIRC